MIELDYATVDGIIAAGKTISTMESCTGGLLAATITDRSGASEIFPGGFVTYCNDAKIAIGVPAETIENFGVYSDETAEAMARTCRAAYGTDIGVGVTGSLGRRDPGNPDSVVGQVHYSVLTGASPLTRTVEIPESIIDRADMKRHVVNAILRDIKSATAPKDAIIR